MHNIIFPLKDCTIYSKFPEINTGLDEILEITKEVSSSNYFFKGTWISSSYYKRYDYVDISGSGNYFAVAENINENPSASAYWQSFSPTESNENSRILIKFDTASFDSTAYQSASVVYLNLFTSIARKVPTEYTLEARAISGSWEMGVGNFTDKLTTGGATWRRKSSTESWITNGGDWIGTLQTQTYNFQPTDIRIDVTDIFNEWVAGTYPNEGFLIKRTAGQEQDKVKYGSLSFYSLDTHTVYVPTLEIAYDDHVYDSSSFIASGSYLSSSFTSSTVGVGEINASGSFIYYYSASVSPSNVNIVTDGTLPSSSVIYYPTESASITINDVIETPEYVLSSSVLYYVSSSVTSSIINVVSGTVYVSSSIDYALLSGSFSTLLYDSGSYVSSSVIYTELSSSSDYSGSLLSGSVSISMKNFKPEYKYNTKVRFRINSKPSYVAKTFYEELRQGEVYYLPDTAYYSIVDAYSNRIMIPFSDYTRISLDGVGHYFDTTLSGFMPERFYKIMFKVTIDGTIQYIDHVSQFKVVK